MKTRDFYDYEAKIENEIKKVLPFVHYIHLYNDEQEQFINIILYFKYLKEDTLRNFHQGVRNLINRSFSTEEVGSVIKMYSLFFEQENIQSKRKKTLSWTAKN